MKWILCFQTATGGIKYYTSDLDNPTYLSFNAFIEYISQFSLHDFKNLLDELDKFKTILIDLDEKSWKIYEIKKEEKTTFEQLYKLNKNKQKDKEKAQDKFHLEDRKEYLHKQSKIKSFLGMRTKDDSIKR